MKKRLLAAVLLAALLLGTSCAGGDTQPVETTADTTEAEETDNSLKPNIPDDLRFDGRTYRALLTTDANWGPVLSEFELDKSADVLTQALYNRLIKTEERFGITVELLYGVEYEIAPMSQQSVASGSYDYDIVGDVANRHLAPIYEGIYTPVNDIPYIDLDQPWWNKTYIESVSVQPDNPYILFGAINLKSVERSTCTFINFDLLEKQKGITADEIYEIVLSGGWTIDKMIELNKDMYIDSNGSTTKDADDYHGLITENYFAGYPVWSAGIEYTARDEDGYPVLAMNNERTITLIDKFIELFHSQDSFALKDQNSTIECFANGHALFLFNRIFTCSWDSMRETEVNYGILPCPKYDETIDQYWTSVANNTQWHMVPITHPDLEFTGAVTEYMAYLGYEEVIPAYYDITVKFKYTRGDVDKASQVLDIITKYQRSDFMSVNDLGGLQNVVQNNVARGQNTFASDYAAYEWLANVKLKQYIEALG